MSGSDLAARPGVQRGVFGLLAAVAMAAYYQLFYLSSRMVGANDPDRYYHLGIARLTSESGLLRKLPQVEDLGWGSYFPDKEFLFHVLTGAADWLGGARAVLALVPALGIGIVLLLYAELSRLLRPWQAALLASAVPLLTADHIFRLSLLRPHLLAIFFFCLLLRAILRRQAPLAATAAAGFALSYHAYYLVLVAAILALPFGWQRRPDERSAWPWAIAGLLLGILINPYFPSNLVMSWTHVQIALGLDRPPGAIVGVELESMAIEPFLLAFGFVPLVVATAIAVAWTKRWRPYRENPEPWYLLVLTLVLLVLGLKSARAMEYCVPAAILLAGYVAQAIARAWWVPLQVAALLLVQGHSAWIYYKDIWSESQAGSTFWYFSAIASLPPEPSGGKVFNCQWDAGAYVLYLRPEMRFVDTLDPAFLWKASHDRYLMRQMLIAGAFEDPYPVLREQFRADYVLCASEPLIRQMRANPTRFQPLPVDGDSGPIRIFQVKQE